MKAILISIKPKWVAKILNGEKTIEIRKTMPKCDLPIDVYIYCTKNGNKLAMFDKQDISKFIDIANGKVVAKFTLNKVEKITTQNFTAIKEHEILKQSCLREYELFDYISKNNGEPDKPFFAWHIINLEIFDKPKELSEFRKWYEIFESSEPTDILPDIKLTKAPQSWCYVEADQ